MMDEQLFELMNRRFDDISGKIDTLTNTVDEHCKQDTAYWDKIKVVEGQFNLLKWLGGTTGGISLLAWLYQVFGHQK